MTEQLSERPLYGLLLAGGQSRRMGQDKALLDRNGESLLSYAARLLQQFTDQVYVSSRAEQRDEPQRSRFNQIIDRYQDLGPAAGILSAMDEHAQADWLVIACDLPNLDAETFGTLLQHRRTDHPFVAYRSSHDDLPEPLCALYLEGSEAIIRRFVDDGLKCPRKMLIRSDTLLLTQPNPGALDNVNTPEDLGGSVLEAEATG